MIHLREKVLDLVPYPLALLLRSQSVLWKVTVIWRFRMMTAHFRLVLALAFRPTRRHIRRHTISYWGSWGRAVIIRNLHITVTCHVTNSDSGRKTICDTSARASASPPRIDGSTPKPHALYNSSPEMTSFNCLTLPSPLSGAISTATNQKLVLSTWRAP